MLIRPDPGEAGLNKADTLKALDLKRKQLLPDGAANPATLGFTAVLHTWTREMQYHPHLHVILPGLSLSADGQRIHRPARADYLMPHRAIARRFKIRPNPQARRPRQWFRIDKVSR